MPTPIITTIYGKHISSGLINISASGLINIFANGGSSDLSLYSGRLIYLSQSTILSTGDSIGLNLFF